ncbi:hypothetical protein [Streptomyces albus]|uniref:hypothetical protein n=1 Tax=Streptomyces albus TaxID=1888 RepID=UPI0006E236D6|nr:hypothetical protein [Streptomyces albus]
MSSARSARRLRLALFAVLAVVLVAAGAAGGYLARHAPEPKRFSQVSSDDCHTVLLDVPGNVVDRLVPRTHYVNAWQKVTRKKGAYSSMCALGADGKQALLVQVQQRDESAPLSKLGSGEGHGDTRKVPGFENGWSSDDSAAVAVPCTKGKKDGKGDKDGDHGDDGNTALHVQVRALAKQGQDVREDVVAVLKKAVSTNHTLACYAAPMEDGSAYD